MLLKLTINKYIVALCFFILSGFFATAMAQCVPTPGVEAVKNGGFENGNDGTSTFGPHTNFEGIHLSYSSPGYYDIHLSPKHFNFGFTNDFPPHSGTKMLMVDAVFRHKPFFGNRQLAFFQANNIIFRPGFLLYPTGLPANCGLK